ncbi:hypothetical protein EV421DRAFT_1736056 [Armillaria borealis]|uniref:Uncharacterized protein n=1 Tax=Armillaria borealis TaxID=47425 RepID=A0AA39JMB2_9AGAR|nr:hypothetical protein EV421DRAFT_1736056 [Armillaria borealis]
MLPTSQPKLSTHTHTSTTPLPLTPNTLDSLLSTSSAPYIAGPNEWNTPGPSDWDILPTSTIRSGSLPWINLSTSSRSLSTAIPVSSVSHIPDVIREDDVSSMGTSSGQLPPTLLPDREWSSRLEEMPKLQDISHTVHSPSALLGLNPRARMEIPESPTSPLSEQPCLLPITLQTTPSPTPRSPVPPQPTTPTSPVPSRALSPQYAPGTSPMESLEASPLPPPTQIPTMDLDKAVWRYLTRRLPLVPPILQNTSVNDLFHHFTSSLPEDPTWLLMIAGRDYMYYTNEIKISVSYILREEAAVHAASLWNRLHWDNQIEVPPGYQRAKLPADSPKPLPLNPDVPPQHADMPDYPLKPRTHGGGPVGSHPMGGRYAGGADPDGDRGGHADFVMGQVMLHRRARGKHNLRLNQD